MNEKKEANLHFDATKLKSLAICPKESRPKGKEKKLIGAKQLLVLKALSASEKEAEYLIGVANRRLERIKAIVEENIKGGQHLVDEAFIPEYLGFSETVTGEIETIRIYSREGFNLTRVDDNDWLMHGPNKEKVVISIPNMFVAITVLGSLGLDVDIDGYMAGNYSTEKSIDDVLDEVLDTIMKDRAAKLLDKSAK